jgi:hypothetical protein
VLPRAQLRPSEQGLDLWLHVIQLTRNIAKNIPRPSAAPQVLLVHRLLSVKEGRKNWEEEISSENNVVMGGTRQDGEL